MRRLTPILAALFAVCLPGLAADTVLPDNLASAQPGEWVLLKDIAGPAVGELSRYTVVEVADNGSGRVVTLRRERYDDSGAVAETTDYAIETGRYAARLADLEARAKQVSREKLAVKGEETTVWAVTWDHKDDDDGQTYEMKLWLAPSLPVGGLVRTWSEDPDFPAAELVDFGRD